MTAFIIRVHDAILLRIWILPASATYAEAGIHAGKECYAAVKAAGRAYGLGNPPLHIWASLIMTAKNDSSLQQGEKEAITADANSVTDPKDLETQVIVCNIRPAFNKEWVRVQFKVSPEIE